jgi:ATP-dependent DNA ligase
MLSRGVLYQDPGEYYFHRRQAEHAGRYKNRLVQREDLPRFVAPMLARTAPMPADDGWAFEVKFDGMRLQLRRDGRAVCLRSKRNEPPDDRN